MSHGIGNDIVEISRIRKSIERHGLHFLSRLFTQSEQDYCYKFSDPAPHFAGHFSAKEAIAKALGTGFGTHLAWLDIEIHHNKLGKPLVTLSKSLLEKYNNPKILLTISHSNDYAAAVALWD